MKRRSDLALFWLWLQGRLRLLLRTPRVTFFTLIFPLILLLMFDALNRSHVAVAGGKVPFAQFFTPSIAIFALTSATYTAVIFGIATARDQGILKRVRGTPIPMWVFLGSWMAGAIVTGVLAVVVMFVVAVPVFGVDLRLELLPAAIITLVLGATAIASIGLAVASFVRRADTAPIVANLTLFPLLFVSGVFYPFQSEPDWLQRVAHAFPLSHLVQAFDACFSPYTSGAGFAVRDLASLALWGALGAFVAVRRFAAEATDEAGTPAASRLWRRASARHASS